MDDRRLALIGIVLGLPFALLLALETFGWGPADAWMRSTTTTDGHELNAFGRAMTTAIVALLPVALAVNVAPLVRQGAGGRPLNLALAACILSVIVIVAGAVVVDQLPCWRGVPACD